MNPSRFSSFAFGAAAAIAALAAPALATTRSSFTDVQLITDLTVVTSNAGRTFTVSLGANPTFKSGATTYVVQDLIGFYLLSDDVDFSPLPALTAVAGFSDDSSNSGTGGIAGWRSNPNNGFQANESLAFTVPSNFNLGQIDRFGFHIRLASGVFPGTSGNTGNMTYTESRLPTPGALALASLGGLLALRRRR